LPDAIHEPSPLVTRLEDRPRRQGVSSMMTHTSASLSRVPWRTSRSTATPYTCATRRRRRR